MIYESGIPFRTLGQGKRLIAWADQRGEDLRTIKKCGHFFDLEKFAVRTDKFGNAGIDVTHVAFIVLFSLAAGLSLSAGVIPKALGQMKASGQWIAVSTTSVKQIGGDGVITRDSCKQEFQNLPKQDAWNADDFRAICNTLESAELEKFVRELVFEQRVTGLAGTILFFGLACLLAAAYFSKVTAQALDRRLKKYEDENRNAAVTQAPASAPLQP